MSGHFKKANTFRSRILRFSSLSFANKMLAIETVLTLLLAWMITRFIPGRYWLRYVRTEAVEPVVYDDPCVVNDNGNDQNHAGRQVAMTRSDATACDTKTTKTESFDPNLPRRIGRVVAKVAHHLPFNARCLHQAMAAQWILGRRGVRSVLVFGVRRNMNVTHVFEYHAWLMVGSEAVIGGDEVDCYKAFPTFSAS